MQSPATLIDLEARWRPLSDQEKTNAGTFLEDAWLMLKRHMQRRGFDLEVAMNGDIELVADVIRVTCTAVLRVMKNPDGKVREQIDDYSWARDEATASGLLYFADDELDGLIPGAGAKGRAFSVSLLDGWGLS